MVGVIMVLQPRVIAKVSCCGMKRRYVKESGRTQLPSVEELQANVQSVLNLMRPLVEAASDLAWSPLDGILPVVRRAMLVRQFDSLEAIAHLIGAQKGYAAAPLLRPACEEVIWIKYLAAITPRHAEELLRCAANIEVLDSLQAQDTYAGRTITKELGLMSFLQDAPARQKTVSSRLRTLGQELGWDSRTIQKGALPSTWWLAKKTDQTALYDFLYRATSRFVHFSTAELLRRAWGKPGTISIRSIHFQDYWGVFALYWGLRLLLDALIDLHETLGMSDVELNQAELLSVAEQIGAFGQVPIITAEELGWPKWS
jgi:hypothetical protein